MTKQVERRVCDNCSRIVESMELQFGGSPFCNWLRIQQTGGSTQLTSLKHDKGPWDFCSKKCAIVFLNKGDKYSDQD